MPHFNCITLVHHILFNSCFGTPLCAARFQDNLGILQCVHTCPKCSVASTLFSYVCRLPTHPLVGLLVSAACSLLSHSTDCQHTDSRIANPKHCHLPDVSHSVSSLHLLASTTYFIGAVKLADKNSSNPPHVQFGSILWMVSAQPNFSKCTTSPEWSLPRIERQRDLPVPFTWKFTTHAQCRTIQPINT